MAHQPFNDWARHPAAFSFSALEHATEAVAAAPGSVMIDPFAGSGRAGTFVTGRGDHFIGIEAHPLMANLASLKFIRPGSPSDLLAATEDLLESARRRTPSLDREQDVTRRFVPEAELRQLVALRDCVPQVATEWQDHLRWLVLAGLRDAVGASWPYPRARKPIREVPLDVFRLVSARAAAMADDLVGAPRAPSATVIAEDARLPQAWARVLPASVDACISSPPYLNQVSYAEVTRLELHFLGLVHTWREMTEQVSRRLVASSTQQVTRRASEHAAEYLRFLPGTSASVTTLSRRLQHAQAAVRRPKKYDQLIGCYVADIVRVLHNLHRALAPGARAAWVVGDSAPYGVYVDTPALLSLAAAELGFEVLDDVFLRERGGRWPSVGGRHERRLSERLVVFRRSPLPSQEPLPGFYFAPA
jgi:hypothetical protein